MNFTKCEQSVIQELEKRAGDVLYLKEIAPFFISKSCLQISTYTQTAYIQLGDNMRTALSEYFQLIVFLKKLENNGFCFSIPYTPLEDNLMQIGNDEFSTYQNQTIADGDLLIQLFHFAGKKYVINPDCSAEFDKHNLNARQSKINFIIPSLILLLLFLLIGVIGYQSYEDHNKMKLKQEVIDTSLKKHVLTIKSLESQLRNKNKENLEFNAELGQEVGLINTTLEDQNKSLKSIRYWNQKQFDQLEKLILTVGKDSIE